VERDCASGGGVREMRAAWGGGEGREWRGGGRQGEGNGLYVVGRGRRSGKSGAEGGMVKGGVGKGRGRGGGCSRRVGRRGE